MFLYTLTYYQLDSILKPCVYDRFTLFYENPVTFYSNIQIANIFILIIFILFTFHLIFFGKRSNYKIYALLFIYMKYIIDNIIYNNIISIYQYEFRRSIMWLFTTPLMLQLYADINNLTLVQINSQYHIISNALHVILYPFRKSYYNIYIIVSLSGLEGYFIVQLYRFNDQKYTKLIIYIWYLFTIIIFIELFHILNIQDIQILYVLCDMIAKLSTILIMNDHDEQLYYIQKNIDLQSIHFLTVIKKSIKCFEQTNLLTPKCAALNRLINDKLTSFIPKDKTTLKLELLKKILPLELEDQYLNQSNEYRKYNFICVLFTDIVSYTELAKKYDESIIYKLLNNIYTLFDDIVIKYTNLQKIETIGDAYMVVGDIYNNDTTNNIKNMVLIAFEFMNVIKTIKTPDNKPLQLRIGMHVGKVVVGILGSEIPRLCVIGNTVNYAARLQSTADADTIQMSHHIYEQINEIDFGLDIEFTKKENVFLKNIGSVVTYNITPFQIHHHE